MASVDTIGLEYSNKSMNSIFKSFVIVTAMLVSSHAVGQGIFVIRHGEGEQNVRKEFNSSPKNANFKEVRLTELGKKQVEATARELLKKGLTNNKIRAVYISPLLRTRETSEIIKKTLKISPQKIEVSETVIETDMGKYEGKKYSDYPWDSDDHSHGHEYGGEDHDDIRKRVKVLLDQVLAQCDKGSNVLIVTHGTPAKHIVEYLTGVLSKDLIKTGGYAEIKWAEAYKNVSQKCPSKL